VSFDHASQVQGQGGSGTKYKGVLDVVKHLYKEGGIRSIYRGTGATLARDGPGSAASVSFFVLFSL
jgi:solute carrier family 25 (mitochondrial carnitine/acylcarnitine transporter), member 20/29